MSTPWARRWHALTCGVAVVALILQTVLVVQGASVLDETAAPPLGDRLVRLVSYFTIQSNVLVAVTTAQLTRDPHRDGRGWRVVRADAVVAIAVTGLVHWFLLRPLLDLEGASALADSLLHLAVPALATVGWVVWGPRPRVDARVVAGALVWPVAWLAYTLLLGALTGWYPYPFIDVSEHGYVPVLITCAGVAVLFLLLLVGLRALERALPPAPRQGAEPSTAGPRHGR